MQMEKHKADIQESADQAEDSESLELVLFQVSECYVYIISPRKSAASYRADEWDVNKWTWEGTLKVISKGEECIIRLEDKKTGELYARAFLRNGEAHPVEPVIDSSRYFVLRVEENIGELLLPTNLKFYNVKETPAGCFILQRGDHAGGRLRHAFIGMGFRERTEAYDFQAALHDHVKYLNKKKTAEEMEQQFKLTSSVDYSLKDGETLVLQIKNNKSDCSVKSKFFQQGLQLHSPFKEKDHRKEQPVLNIKLPPPPPAPTMTVSPLNSPRSLSLEKASIRETPITVNEDQVHRNYPEEPSTQNVPDDDFGDFQTAV